MSIFNKSRDTDKLKTDGLSVKTKLIVFILPVVIASLVVLTSVTTLVSQKVILSRSDSQMQATLGEYTNQIAGDLDVIKSQADELSLFIAATHESVSIEEYKNALCAVVVNNDMILGSGIWFEPNVYVESEKYYGPYWYKNIVDGKWDGADLIETWDYSNAEYDYFNQEYYINAKNMQSASITDPYYDETSGLVMATCSAPIRDRGGNYLGCVTVDVMLSSMNETLASIRVGETGTVWLLDSAGTYIYHPAFDTSKEAISITSSTELGEYINAIQTKDAGKGDFVWDNQTRLLYWSVVPNTNWKMGLTITQSELFAEIQKIIYIGIIICILAGLICTAILLWQTTNISKAVQLIAKTLNKLSEGEFKKVEGAEYKDEFGVMIKSTNFLVDKLTEIVGNIKASANNVSESSDELSDMTNQISQTTDDVANAVQEIASGATQQADEVQNITTNVDTFSEAISEVSHNAEHLKDTAMEMDTASRQSADTLQSLLDCMQKMSNALDAIAVTMNATNEAVTAVNEKVEGIDAIATQTNLLSLNASIEAARAGEAGKGFSVVAEEIGKLAKDSSDMAHDIKEEMTTLLNHSVEASDKTKEMETIGEEIKTMINNTSDALNNLITDVQNTVEGVESISENTKSCDKSKTEIVDSIGGLSAISEENAAAAEETGASMEELNATVTTLSASANNLKDLANKLDEEMKFFKL